MDENKKIKDKKATQRRITKKSGVAFLIAIIVAILLIVRIIVINVVDGKSYSKIVNSQQAYTSRTIKAKRGDIVDRNGTVLAYSKKVYNLVIDPQRIDKSKDKDKLLDSISKLTNKYFKVSRKDLVSAIDINPNNRYKIIKKQIEESVSKSFLEDIKADPDKEESKTILSALWFEEDYVRTYPFSTLAADVIGFSSETNGGEIGLESYYNDYLMGVDGLQSSYVVSSNDVEKALKEAQNGNSVVTTIDYGVQNILEKAIKEYNGKKKSANTAAIVMDPNNGEILGMASYPNFDLNNPRDLTVEYSKAEIAKMTEQEKTNALYSLWSNYAVSSIYEPGSTFKSITVATGLEDGTLKKNQTFNCNGSLEVDDYIIQCWRNSEGGHGKIGLEEALGDSCNVALMEIAKNLGAKKLIDSQRLFGFGTKTGIDLPGEERGLVYDPSKMSDVDVATNSFGQSINVTMVQMVSAYASLLNGGTYYQPHVVKEIKDEDGNIVKSIQPTVVRQTITADTSDTIRKYLGTATEKYAVKYSKVEGYSMGGKTATAQKIPRSEKKWLISVMSFAPVDNPKFILYVLIDEPAGTTGGEGDGMDSQRLTKTIMTELLPYIGVQKGNNKNVSSGKLGSETGVNIPDVNNKATDTNVTEPEDVRQQETTVYKEGQ